MITIKIPERKPRMQQEPAKIYQSRAKMAKRVSKPPEIKRSSMVLSSFSEKIHISKNELYTSVNSTELDAAEPSYLCLYFSSCAFRIASLKIALHIG